MPFQSQAQAGWAFATGQPFARRWARETGPYKKLPKRVKRKTCMACVLASLKAVGAGPTAPAPRPPRVAGAAPKPAAGGKGQQIAPGVTRIRGNLCNVHGRYGPCDAALSKQPKGRKPKGAKRAAAPKKRATRAAQGRTPRAANPDQARRQAQRDAEHQQDRQARAQRQAARDTERAQDRAARAQRQADADKQRAARQAEPAKKPAAAGGGGGKKKKPEPRATRQTPEQRRDEHRASVRQQMADTDTGLAPAGFDNLIGLAAGREPDAQGAQSLIAMGLAERGGDGTLRLTGPGRVAVNAANRGDAKAAVDAISRGQDQASARQQRADERAQRDAARAQREQERAAERAARTMRLPTPTAAPVRRRTPIVMPSRSNRGTRRKAADPGDYLVVLDRTKPSTWHLQVKKNGKADHRLMGAAWAALHGGYRGNTYSGPNASEALTKLKRLYASEKMPVPSEKSFAVFKDSAGAWRWLSRTTTAYEDRDSEVISTKALEDSADSAAPRGPLRWWHMGRPDPFSPDQPWGPGVDLGWCDFAAVSGRTLIESGTFKSEALARAVAAHADDLELSPGFFHAAGEPDASGVFSHIRIFERSLVPKWAGRASNPYTGLVVEKTMDQKKIQALKELGASDEVITALLADVAQTEKSAEADGVRYKDARPVVDFFARLLRGEQVTTKDEEAAPEAAAPEPEPEPAPVGQWVAGDVLASLKAQVEALTTEVASLKAGAPVAEEKAGDMMGGDMMGDAETPMEDTAEGGMEESGEEGGLTLSAEDLTAIGQVIGATLEPLIGALGITQKLEGHLGELKTMMGGFVKQKDDAQAAIVARLDQTDAKVAELVGDAPRQAGFRASASAENTLSALVNTASLKDGSTPDPDNPFADLVEKLFNQGQR